MSTEALAWARALAEWAAPCRCGHTLAVHNVAARLWDCTRRGCACRDFERERPAAGAGGESAP